LSRKQLLALSCCSLVIWTVANGVVVLLPVYATQLGAAPAAVGYYMALTYVALTAGSVAAGTLSDRLGHRKRLLVVVGLAGIPAAWLIGHATNAWQLAVLATAVLFVIGMGVVLIGILAGLFADEAQRGQVFGVLGLTAPLAGLIAGLVTGPIADRWGFPTMFAALGLVCGFWPLMGLLVEDKAVAPVPPGTPASARQRPGLGCGLYLLLLGGTVAVSAGFVRVLGTSLAMEELGFSAAAISSTGAVGGAVVLPLLPLVGWLSDRLGRRRFLALSYLGGTVGLLVLAVSVSLWHFWVAACLVSVLFNVYNSLAPALVTDLVPQASLGTGMSLFGATGWVGGIIGFAVTGQAVQSLGMRTTFILGAFLPALAILLLIPIRPTRREDGIADLAPLRAR
jgi:MFS family permease